MKLNERVKSSDKECMSIDSETDVLSESILDIRLTRRRRTRHLWLLKRLMPMCCTGASADATVEAAKFPKSFDSSFIKRSLLF